MTFVNLRHRASVRVGLLLSLALIGGCASAPGPRNAQDPFEPWNRGVFSFNESLDKNVLKPVATGYVNVVPQIARTGIHNFFGNFADAWSAINSFLQGKVGNGVSDLMRVATNTTIGLGGLIDWATELRIGRYPEDFGQTLGVWGAGDGPYVVWPLFGSSTVRDSFALPVDVVGGSPAVGTSTVRFGLAMLQIVDIRANLLGAGGVLDDAVLDKYTFVRDAHLQRRRNLIYDGDPPPLPEQPNP